MGLTIDDLLAGPKLPPKNVYIEALEDTVEILPVSLERYREYKDADDETLASDVMQVCIAESISSQSGMTLEEATELNAKVQAKLHPAAWDEMTLAVMETMFGKDRFSAAGESAGKD